MLQFVYRVAFVFGAIGLALAAWTLKEVLLVVFAAFILANGMSAVANFLKYKHQLPYALALALVVIAAAAAIGALLWFFGATIIEQIDELQKKIPDGLQWIRKEIESRPYVRDVLSNFDIADLSGPTGWLATTLAPKLKSVAAAAGSLIVSVIVSVYLASQPYRYRSGLLLLVPPGDRGRAERLFEAISRILARWLLGQFAVMATVGALSGLGLWLLGVRAAFVLGLAGGLLSFIPFFGSVLAAVLAALFALGQGPVYALAVIAMYVAVHFIEGNLITPLIQSEATSLPPALTLVSVIGWVILFGAPAAFLAVPLTLVILTAVNVLYVETIAERPLS
jgi:predicted PurR-regulated permease PerM